MSTLAELEDEYGRIEVLCDRFDYADLEGHADAILTPLGEAVDEGLVPEADYEAFKKALKDVEKALNSAYKTLANRLCALDEEMEDLEESEEDED